MVERERKHEFKFYLSDAEAKILEEKMKLLHAPSKSYLIRQLIIYSFNYEVDYRELKEVVSQLGKIGNNINQIARRINETRSIYKNDIDELKKEFDKICRSLESMLSKQP